MQPIRNLDRTAWRLKALAFALALLAGVATPGMVLRADPSYGEICVDPDIEFPVACDDDED